MPPTVPCRFSSPVSAVEFDIHVDDPIQHLLNCHRKMARSLAVIQTAVKSLELTEPVLRAEAIAALDYELALLQLLDDLHRRDEEESFLPHLRSRAASDTAVLENLTKRFESHRLEKEAIFGELAGCLRDISRQRGDLRPEQLKCLENCTNRLELLLKGHVASDNDPVLEACRQHLTPGDLEDMRKAMRARFRG